MSCWPEPLPHVDLHHDNKDSYGVGIPRRCSLKRFQCLSQTQALGTSEPDRLNKYQKYNEGTLVLCAGEILVESSLE
ncbi:hypothetical protein TIFTF001_034489 [Ficus carica]|uniref:Uncharacterized protein n=1 Tax=Ficus carica TaxID=3494 RepID=A0AA88E7Z8_FICCA|nr:hypothetical protein TIFTF001_034489 [Ficus carica]